MPIEDVDFMKAHSEKQSYVFLVDSKDRDRTGWPTPAEYVVEFTSPFRNVVGLDVLDASVPRTMYNVDVNNNTISFCIYTGVLPTIPVYTTVAIEPGDYTIQTVTVAINAKLHAPLSGGAVGDVASITCEPISTPPDVKNILRFRSAYSFILDMNDSTMAETLGFDELTQATEAAKPPLERRYEIPYTNTDTGVGMASNRRIFGSVNMDSSTSLGPVSTVFEGPRGVILSHSLAMGPVAQKFTLTEDGYFTGVYVALGGVGLGAAFEVRTGVTGTADIPDMTAGGLITGTTGTIALSAVDGTLSDGVPAQKVKLVVNTEYWLIVKALTGGQSITVFYNDVIATATTLKYLNDGEGTWSSYDAVSDGIYYNMSARIETAQPYHVVTSPGIFSLVGERYIILRCPEIEAASYRSLAYSKHTLGLAKFKLGVVGYSENRLDFSSVPSREFHPLGKLSKLTLRFERPGGDLYDFKGANHTITFAVKYYEAVQKETFTHSIINPNYNGDLIQYFIDQDASDADSDDQDYDYSRVHLANYRQNERDNLPD